MSLRCNFPGCRSHFPYGQNVFERQIMHGVADATGYNGEKDPRVYWYCPSKEEAQANLDKLEKTFQQKAWENPSQRNYWFQRFQKLKALMEKTTFGKQGCRDKHLDMIRKIEEALWLMKQRERGIVISADSDSEDECEDKLTKTMDSMNETETDLTEYLRQHPQSVASVVMYGMGQFRRWQARQHSEEDYE